MLFLSQSGSVFPPLLQSKKALPCGLTLLPRMEREDKTYAFVLGNIPKQTQNKNPMLQKLYLIQLVFWGE